MPFSVSPVASASTGAKTAKQKLAKKNELKPKSTLMLAIPDEHLLKFHACKDAKSLWEAIKNRFGGNKESKKMQKTILKQNYKNFAASSQEGLDKTYDRSLPSAWNNIALVMRNKSDLDTLSMDDLYNNLKVYESEIKRKLSSSSNSQNVSFVSSDNSSSTNETVNTAHSVSTTSSKDQASTASYADDIDADDLEEMDLKWQVAMLTMRVKRRDGIGGYGWRFWAEEGIINFALMAYTSQGSSSLDSEREALNKSNLEIIGYQMGLKSLESRIVVHEKNEVVYEEDITFLMYDVQVKDISIKDLKNHQISAKDKTGLCYDSQMNESEVVHSVFNSRESDVNDSLINDRFKTGEGFYVVPPPYTRNYMPLRPDLSFIGLDDSIYKTKVSETKTSISKTSKDIVEKPKIVRPSAPIIEEWDTDSDNDSVFRPKSDQTKLKFTKINFVKSGENVKTVNKENTHKQVEYPRKKKPVLNNKGRVTGKWEIRPVWNNAQRANHQNKLTHPHPKRNFVPIAVATKSGRVPVNTAKQSSPRATTSISTARPVNTVAPKPKVNDALTITYSYFKAHSLVRRASNKKSAAKTNNFNERVNIARVNNVTTAGPKAVVSAAEGNGENAVKSSACWIRRLMTSNNITILKTNTTYPSRRYGVSVPALTKDHIRLKINTPMDDPNMTMEEYIKLEEEKAHRRGRVFNWQTATYGKIRVDDDLYDLSSVEAEFPAIRHPFLRYQGLEYSDADIADLEERLERIYSREIHRVQVVDFQGMPELMRDGLFTRIRMEHRDDAGVVVFTSRAWGRLFGTRGPLVRELILEFLSMLRFGEVLLDFDAPGTIQFQLGEARR
ncbi:hypothetical protein Tco_0956131 [Tanacetum coccineum]|uniref:Uncharacterized protein n=1 Tax=Tanacetum coccineum TaxID=301880 RepID=A0ABQ5E944_9ASTR